MLESKSQNENGHIRNVDDSEAESFLPQRDLTHRKHLRSPRCGVISFFFVLNISALFLLYVALNAKSTVPAAFPNPFPSIEYEIRSFAAEYNRDPSIQDSWESHSELPIDGGATWVDNAEALGLPPGASIKGKPYEYGVSWTHQYHCLTIIHEAYATTRVNLTLTARELDYTNFIHIQHCFDYLRQHIEPLDKYMREHVPPSLRLQQSN
ncbi:hypothetical protein F5Y16DRAFT_406503 [Xylariaceae sp. FL0255]|nr:hypothetical protein F5Y16DRAFT_406503 [Xylariaceae sp. FL0255]